MTFSTFAFAFALVLLSGLSTSIGGALAVGRREPGPALWPLHWGFRPA